MEDHHRIAKSRAVYARLLKLYPAEHYAEYGPDMLQVFTDECRSISATGNTWAFLTFWMRMLADLIKNAFKEHVTSPGASVGLLEPVPNRPLPWKGVALVLLPGILFFASQVGQLTGKDWFYWMLYRAGFYMMPPVLLVWLWKKRFPIWGLIPLGVLFNTPRTYVNQLPFYPQIQFAKLTYMQRTSGPWSWIGEVTPTMVRVALMAAILLALIGLLLASLRRERIAGRAWLLLGAYLAATAAWTLIIYQDFAANNPISANFTRVEMRSYFIELAYEHLYIYGGFLGLVLVGLLLSRRHGQLAALLPLGFLIPSVLFGRISNDWPAVNSPEFSFMLSVSIVAVLYRFLVAIAAPVWLTRSASEKCQRRAALISILILLATQVCANIYWLVQYNWLIENLYGIAYLAANQLIYGTGMALALTLYRPNAVRLEEEEEQARRVEREILRGA